MVPDITDLPRAIQLALTPVFLLTGIGGLLSVMTSRLSRIIARGRALHVAMHTLRIAAPNRSNALPTRRPTLMNRVCYSIATKSRRFADDSPPAAPYANTKTA